MIMQHEERIRERAYTLWESDGRQQHRDMDYWLLAEAEIRAEAASPRSKVSKPKARAGGKPKASGPTAKKTAGTKSARKTTKSTRSAKARS